MKALEECKVRLDEDSYEEVNFDDEFDDNVLCVNKDKSKF